MKRGFTLIELLIVVAIIAILAAIAVPNFLEAQVRSKVSRVHSDMRSLATAVEAYQVDYNKPPVVRFLLTSPIAYIGALPKDPFMLVSGGMDKQQELTAKKADYAYERTHAGQSGQWLAAFNMGYGWWFYTFGPSRNGRRPDNPNQNMNSQTILSNTLGFGSYVYDPSNGTISLGYILRTNKGIYTGPGK